MQGNTRSLIDWGQVFDGVNREAFYGGLKHPLFKHTLY